MVTLVIPALKRQRQRCFQSVLSIVLAEYVQGTGFDPQHQIKKKAKKKTEEASYLLYKS